MTPARLLGLALGLLPIILPAQDFPEFSLRRISSPIRVDGNPDDKAWLSLSDN